MAWAQEKLHVFIIRIASALLAAISAALVVAEVATFSDPVVRAYGLGVASAMGLAMVFQVTRWRNQPDEDDSDIQRQFKEPRFLTVAGLFTGIGLLLVPSPSPLGWWNVPVLIGLVTAACLTRYTLFKLCAAPKAAPAPDGTGNQQAPAAAKDADADDHADADATEGSAAAVEAASPVEVPLAPAPLAAPGVAVATVVIGGDRDAPVIDLPTQRDWSWPVVTAAVAAVLIVIVAAASLGLSKLNDDLTTGPDQSTTTTTTTEPATTTTAAEVPSTTEAVTTTAVIYDPNRDLCEQMLEAAAPANLWEAWQNEFTLNGSPIACPKDGDPAEEASGYFFKDGAANGTYMGDSYGQGSFVFSPLDNQIIEVFSDRDLSSMGGAPAPREVCLEKGNIQLFVDEDGRPRGVAIRDRRVEDRAAKAYELFGIDDFSAWWTATVRSNKAQVSLDPAQGQPAEDLPDTVEQVMAYC